jgi:hypothetical protein
MSKKETQHVEHEIRSNPNFDEIVSESATLEWALRQATIRRCDNTCLAALWKI